MHTIKHSRVSTGLPSNARCYVYILSLGAQVIAVVTASGSIVLGKGTLRKQAANQEIASLPMCELLDKLRDDPTVWGVVVRVDSPGIFPTQDVHNNVSKYGIERLALKHVAQNQKSEEFVASCFQKLAQTWGNLPTNIGLP